MKFWNPESGEIVTDLAQLRKPNDKCLQKEFPTRSMLYNRLPKKSTKLEVVGMVKAGMKGLAENKIG